MEKIIKLAQTNYDFGLQDHLVYPYLQDLSSKPENVEEIAKYTIAELRAKKANTSLLILLNSFVDRCPGHVFNQHGSNWVQLLIRNAPDNQKNLGLILRVLTNIINNIVLNNSKKELDAKAIEKVVEFCTQLYTKGCVLESLTCLELVLKTYPENCSFVSKNIHKYLLQFVDSPSRAITEQVGVCMIHLYQVKGGICRGSTLEQSWMQLQNSLLANIFTTVNSLLEDELLVDVKLLAAFMELEWDSLTKPVLCQRLLNLTNYLQTALLVPLPTAKPIHAAKIIDLIYRVLEENSPFFSDKNMQRDITIGPYLHHIHKSYLTLLGSVFDTLMGNALLFNKTICGVLKIVLKRSSRAPHHPYQAEYRSQKSIIYELAQEWVRLAKSGQDVEQLVHQVLDDIWLQLKQFDTVVRENQDDKSKLLSKEKGSRKRKHNSVEEQKIQSASKNMSHVVDACVTAAASLECLNSILSVFGHSLNTNQHHLVLTNVHIFAKKLVEAAMWENPLWSDDYNLMQSVCKVLITFNSSSHHLHRSSINYTLSLLEMIRSVEPQNRELCLQFQNNLETIFHYPRAPVVIVNPSAVLLQEPEIPKNALSVDLESSDEEVEEVAEEGENEITSTVDGQAEDKIESVPTKPSDSAEVVATDVCISSEEEDEAVADKDTDNTSEEVMEVVDIASDDESVEELTCPEVEEKKSSPIKERPVEAVTNTDQSISTENQASVDDIMSEFVDEVL